ncbi:MAG: hypothetical protein IIA65_08585 [Planctomycetes bacterium]|nr:hypothetical protein [Planctomycetota bacterium]
MPKFVILEHQREGEETHWDLMLEVGDILKTFRLDTSPELIAQDKTQATSIFDHDRRFLTYEGPVNQGEGRVCKVDAGTYETRSQDSAHWKLTLVGQTLSGEYELNRSEANIEAWSFTRS